MVKPLYLPERGHVVWLDFDPQSGHEQAGRRPALVLSPAAYNVRSRLAIVCPISSRSRRYPFELPIPRGCLVNGTVLSDHVRSVDWRSRGTEFWCELPLEFVAQVTRLIAKLIA